MSTWDKLSMAERAEVMRLAVEGGVYDLDAIRNGYNEFAEGGNISDEEYYSIMERVAKENNPRWNELRIKEGGSPLSLDEEYMKILNDNSYNYRGFYNENPDAAANADTHWPDTYKTVWHPTFSNESIYSGQKSQYNPLGLPGGFWSGNTFIPMAWQLVANEYKKGGSIHISPSKRGTFTAAAKKHGKSVQAFASQVLAHPENNSPAIRKKANFARNAAKWHGFGGNLFDGTTMPTQKMSTSPNIFRRPDGTYFYQASPEEDEITVVPRIVLADDPAYWTYADANGKLYTPKVSPSVDSGTVTQGESPSYWDKFVAASNRNYSNPILGAPARWEASLSNGTNPIQGAKNILDFVPVAGDALQGIDALKDAAMGDYTAAGLGLGMLAVPNLIEKPLKYLGKGIRSVFELTDNQWDEMYNAAIKANDMEEAQRLRDLHFMAKAPDTAIANEGLPIHAYHGTGKQFNEFDTTGKYSTLDEGYYGVGAYFAPNKEIADMYADTERTPIVYDTYLNIKDPLRHVRDENADLYGKPIVGNDGVISVLPDDLVDPDFDMTEFVATKPNQIKKADVITYDDAGNIIPLSQRDNFALGDMRYGLIPFGIGLTGYGLFNNQEALGGRIKRRKR